MKKSFFSLLLIFGFLLIVSAGTAHAWWWSFNISSEPSEVVMMSGTNIYFVPDRANVFFYDGYWWKNDNGWHRGEMYGKWVVVQSNLVPGPLFKVPKDYQKVYAKAPRIKYKQWKDSDGQSKKQGRGKPGRGGKH